MEIAFNIFIGCAVGAALCILIGIWIELRATRKIMAARWDYERARFITSGEDCLSETEVTAILMDVLSHPYELPHTIRKSSATRQHEAVCQCGQPKCKRI